MTKRQLAKESGYSRPGVDELLAKGATPEEIIEKGKTRQGHTEPNENFLEAQRRKEVALADLRELELAQKSGELVDRTEVNNFIGTMILKARDILLRIAPELKDRLATETDPIEIENLIEAEVRQALGHLATYNK